MTTSSLSSGATVIEVSKSLLESQGEIYLPLKGNCMWPVLRNGDVLKIQRTAGKVLNFGDVGIFQTSPTTLHANIIFNAACQAAKDPSYVGQVTAIERKGKQIYLEERGFWSRLFSACLCPSNPYGLGSPSYFFRKLRKAFQRKN